MHARFTATQLGIIRDVVMDERRRVEMFDSRSRRERPTMIAPHCMSSRNADERTVTLATILGIGRERIVEITPHVRVRTHRNEGIDDLARKIGIFVEIRFKNLGMVGLASRYQLLQMIEHRNNFWRIQNLVNGESL